jgi:hypothetical protein
MGICRVVQPAIVRLPISAGDYLDVQQELNAGDYRDMILALSEHQAFAKVLAYLLGWSFVGPDGQPLPYGLELPLEVRRETVRSLDTDTARELVAAIDRHEAASDAAREEKKRIPAGGGAS